MVQAQWSLGWENILLDKIQDSATTNYKNLKSSGYLVKDQKVENMTLNRHLSLKMTRLKKQIKIMDSGKMIPIDML